jgi:AraC-like DNA-binding protein
VLLSRRTHRDPDGVVVALERAVSASWLVRRADLGVLVQDEAACAGTSLEAVPASRDRLLVLLSGAHVTTTRGRTSTLRPGEVLSLPSGIPAVARDEGGVALELELDATSPLRSGPFALGHGRLGRRAQEAARGAAEAMSRGVPGAAEPALRKALFALLASLAAEGLPVRAVAAWEPEPLGVDPRTSRALDDVLTSLEAGPGTVSLASRLDVSVRTAARRMGGGAEGRGFRAVRDHYRLLVALLLASHPRATTAWLARSIGYSGPDALCHAFARAGLASPSAYRMVPT